jgi:hypothetical protein
MIDFYFHPTPHPAKLALMLAGMKAVLDAAVRDHSAL